MTASHFLVQLLYTCISAYMFSKLPGSSTITAITTIFLDIFPREDLFLVHLIESQEVLSKIPLVSMDVLSAISTFFSFLFFSCLVSTLVSMPRPINYFLQIF